MSEALQQDIDPAHLQPCQALVIRPDGTADMVFLGVVPGREIHGTYREHAWVAHEAHDAEEPNEVATAFACSLGWAGGVLRGTVVFTGAAPAPDVPGVVVAQVVRFLGEINLS